MQTANKKTIALIAALISICFFTSCTNWEKKYKALNVEHENVKGLLDHEKSEKGQLAEQVTKGQQTIEDLQKQIAKQHKSAAEVTGFGEGYDVSLNPRAGTITVTLPTAILFDSGNATLKRATVELDHIKSVLQRQYAGRRVDVIGHTDTDPIKKSKWQDNWELSAQRALSVVRYLAGHGISKDKIRAVGCGESWPIASNSAAGGKAKNRRVEIVVYMR